MLSLKNTKEYRKYLIKMRNTAKVNAQVGQQNVEYDERLGGSDVIVMI